ncbi:hypothetical protein MC885_012207 [Smutsia gigantea]|nr:hypothetical protein MC885_012207 [Smutsia gigantea]
MPICPSSPSFPGCTLHRGRGSPASGHSLADRKSLLEAFAFLSFWERRSPASAGAVRGARHGWPLILRMREEREPAKTQEPTSVCASVPRYCSQVFAHISSSAHASCKACSVILTNHVSTVWNFQWEWLRGCENPLCSTSKTRDSFPDPELPYLVCPAPLGQGNPELLISVADHDMKSPGHLSAPFLLRNWNQLRPPTSGLRPPAPRDLILSPSPGEPAGPSRCLYCRQSSPPSGLTKPKQHEISITRARDKSAHIYCKVPIKEFGEEIIYWYRQKPDQSIKYLIYVSGTSNRGSSGGKNNKFEASKNLAAFTSTLKVNFLEKEDEAVYYCAFWTDTAFKLPGSAAQEPSPDIGGDILITQLRTSITKKKGNTAFLECQIKTGTLKKNVYVHWYRQKPDQPIKRILYISSNENVVHEQGVSEERYEARKPQEDLPASLRIHRVKEADAGLRLDADISPKPTIFLPSIAEINLHKAGTYLCLLEKFFPDAIRVHWKEKNGKTILESQQGNTVKTNDTYMKFSWLTVIKKSMDREYECIVTHENNKGGVDQEILFPSIKKVVSDSDSAEMYPAAAARQHLCLLHLRPPPPQEPRLLRHRCLLSAWENSRLRRGQEFMTAGTYLCLLEKFFPDVIKIHWKEKNGRTVLESQQGNTVKTNDTYLKFSWLTVTEKSMDKEYKCIITHEKNKGGVDQEILFPSVNEVVAAINSTKTCLKNEYEFTAIDSTKACPKDENEVMEVTAVNSTKTCLKDEYGRKIRMAGFCRVD